MKKITIGAIAVVALLMVAVVPSAFAVGYDDNIVYRADGNWYLSENPQSYVPGTAPVTDTAPLGGFAGDVPMVGDVNGDGIDDIIVTRDAGNYGWYAGHTDNVTGQIGSQTYPASDSSLGGFGTAAGNAGNFLADVTGNDADDAITINAGFNWYCQPSGAGGLGTGGALQAPVQFGLAGDQPIVGDWNGDGFKDIGVYRQAGGNIFTSLTGGGVIGTGGSTPIGQIGGAATDTLLVGNLNGDLFDDIVMVRQDGAGLIDWYGLVNDGNGYFDYFNPGTTVVGFGLDGTDVPFLADINGDGMDDIGITRGGNLHYVTYTTAGGALGTNGAGDTNWAFGLSTDTQLFGQFSVIPEPATLGMLLIGGAGLWIRRRFTV